MRVTLIFVVFLIISFPITTHGEALSYWYSNDNKIGSDNNRHIWSTVIDGFSVSDFNSYMNYGRDQWKNEVGIYTYGSNDKVSSSIHWYGGSQATLREMEPSLANLQAVAVIKYEYKIGTHTYNGSSKDNWRIKSEIYTPKLPWYYMASAKTYRIMFTHELGHGLGWLGHSTNTDDLMYANSKTDSLTTRDKNHLKQNY